jgi:hypothetical protein
MLGHVGTGTSVQAAVVVFTAQLGTAGHCVTLYAPQGAKPQVPPPTVHCGLGHAATENTGHDGVSATQNPATAAQPGTAGHCSTL